MSDSMVCPHCKVLLTAERDDIYCPSCSIRWNKSNGYFDFLGEKEVYWGEISAQEMERYNRLASEKSWKYALQEVGRDYPDLMAYLVSNGRVDWLFHCLDSSHSESCLDIGSGWGSNSFGLAKYYDTVWSLEAVRSRIEFQRTRRAQQDTKNLKLVRADWLALPFPDCTFDLVVANGVLEWVALSDYSRKPRNVQLDFLKEVYRVLKPSGCVYVGTENRFGYITFLGARDHSGLRFTNLLPRGIADIVVRRVRNRIGTYSRDMRTEDKWPDYRTCTYSLWGYQKILRESGFHHADVYWTGSYNEPRISGPLDGESFKHALRSLRYDYARITNSGRVFVEIGSRLPASVLRLMNRFLSPSFLIFAYKDETASLFQSRLLAIDHESTSYVKFGGSLGENSKISYFTLNGSRLSSVLKFPRFVSGAASLEAEEELMERFNDIKIEKTRIGNSIVYVEPPIAGHCLEPGNLRQNHDAIEWLIRFQQTTQNGAWGDSEFKSRLKTITDTLSEIRIDADLEVSTLERIEAFSELIRDGRLPRNSEHGDFFPGNIMVSDEGQVFVTDWEFYCENGDALFDFVFFLLSVGSGGCDPVLFRRNLSGNGYHTTIINRLLSQFSKGTGIDLELIVRSFPYVILRCISRELRSDDRKQVNAVSYMRLLKVWDELCAEGYAPITLQTSTSPLE